jgi:3-oxoacyl-[acyl-carrier-protein] synthase II
MTRRVVITAASVLCPIARGYEGFARALRDGVSGGRPVTLFDASAFPTRVAAEVQGFDPEAPLLQAESEGISLGYEGFPTEDRKTALGLAAALGLRDALGELPRGAACALHLGTGLSSATVAELRADLLPWLGEGGAFDAASYGRAVMEGRSPSPWRHLTDEANRLIARALGLRGPSSSNFSACAASTQAIGRAARDIQAGRVERAVAGGMDSMIHPFGMISFMRLGALTTRNEAPASASRPFDRDREGFLIGEGAVMLLLESLEAAQGRGAAILAEIVGYGTSMDAHAITAPHPEGRGALLAMRRALRDAGMEASEVDYINAHGTGTPLNDVTEARAVAALWRGAGAAPPPMSSTKSMTGHLVAAAGALEALACVAALEGGFLPPSINIEHLDPACEVPIVDSPRGVEVAPRVAMNNSFGFGGQNASLILRRWEGA